MQALAVALIVTLAALYVLWRFLPARWRNLAAKRLGLGAGAGQAGHCHACGDCGACATPAADSDK
ncbi:MAG TPA: hypothetical protein PK214_05800 [Ottowia sp.]|jgi:hypothetical protein|nr:MAG: hypothetical protein E6Q81_05290 [Thermomonas sp.]HMT58357.1 hypothetical protein [Ottowia sp.]HOK11888.1 hypothetical protein [Ottowia sp.]HOM20450.1 hypothetical protein [Ottowia sp.]HOZ94394.1 hypothetical protein [Ottowia sp.]